MGQVLTRARWNGLIQQINDLSENPPDGCDALDPLSTVGARHKWSRNDIFLLQDQLLAICNENTFSGDVFQPTWKQSVISELDTAIDKEWCGCEPELWEGPYEVDFDLDTTGYGGSSQTNWYDDFYCPGQWYWMIIGYPGTEWSFGPGEWQVGPPGITGRFARLKYHEAGSFSQTETGADPIEYSWSNDVTGYTTFPIDDDGYLRITSRVYVTGDGGHAYQSRHPTCEQYPVRHDDYDFSMLSSISVSNVKLYIDRYAP